MIMTEFESIIFGIIFLLLYKIYININNKKKKKSTDILDVKVTNNINININKAKLTLNFNKIECKCKTFFIDESELEGCEYCIAEYLNKHKFNRKNFEII